MHDTEDRELIYGNKRNLIHIMVFDFINETMERLKMGDNRYANFPGKESIATRHSD